MPRTIMIADETYRKLKQMKETQRMSFTTLLERLMNKPDWEKRKERLTTLAGKWKDDPAEDAFVQRVNKEGWENWKKKSASTRM